jgi:glycogen debranching enzyme
MNDQMTSVRIVRPVPEPRSAASGPTTPPRLRQPYLHDLVTAVRAPGVVLSASDGQLNTGAHGVYWADRRLLSTLLVLADGHAPAGVSAVPVAPGHVRFLGVLRELGDTGADPTVTVRRDREVIDSGLVETITVQSAARNLVETTLTVQVACDLVAMAAIKSGHSPALLPADAAVGGLTWRGPDGSVVALRCDPASDSIDDATLSWAVRLEPGECFTVTVDARLAAPGKPTVLPAGPATSPSFSVRSGDYRLDHLVAQSLADLESLRLADPLDPGDQFFAAGAPWFLTLFGRDAIWAARMSLPLGTELAGGTLRALARRQGAIIDAASAQQPGKIMHEIRPTDTEHDDATGGIRLPALYYGTVDATALWISLLHDAWRWGLPADEVEALLPAAARAMDWLIDYGAPDGFVSYRDATGHGLANQGWKDSGDSVQFRDGSLATPPIALCEVQGYAFAAARQAAELFDAFAQPGGDRWRVWANELATRFRSAFWVTDADGDYPAIALDADGKPVDTVTSNIGHLLGTGLLTEREEVRVVARLGRDDMASGYGLRTMSTTAAGFNPLAYHGGSVWSHDTAIVISGLTGSDAPAASGVAADLASGLLAAAPTFEFRLPELFGGHPRAEYSAAVPYPAACRPQAWSAAAAIAVVTALLGLRVDVPARAVHLRPMRPSPVGAFEVCGLQFGEASFDVGVTADGDPVVRGLARDVTVTVA